MKRQSKPAQHVLFVLDHFYPFVGGAETLFWQHSRGLAARGHRVTVVTLREPGAKAAETVDGVEIHRVRAPRWGGRYLFILLAIPVVLRYARRADLIHAGVYASAFAAWLCGAILRKPTVLTVHEVFGNQWQRLADVGRLAGWAFRLYERLVLGLPFTRIVCVSRFTADRLRQLVRIQKERVSVVYNAVDCTFWDRSLHRPADLRHELKLSPETFIYLYFGRPGVSKGVDTLVAAAAKVREAMPASRLVLVLSREPAEGRRRVLEQIREFGLEDHAIVRDSLPRAELPGWLLGADCVVVPSLSEGFGYSAVEAATLGCRVVATTGHAVEEVLGGTVDLVPPQDAEALARAVLSVARTRPAAREAPHRFTLDAHVRGMLEVYRQAVAAKGSAPFQAASVLNEEGGR